MEKLTYTILLLVSIGVTYLFWWTTVRFLQHRRNREYFWWQYSHFWKSIFSEVCARFYQWPKRQKKIKSIEEYNIESDKMRVAFEKSQDMIQKLQLGIKCMAYYDSERQLYSQMKDIIYSIVSSRKDLQDRYVIPEGCHVGNIAIIAQRLDDELNKKGKWWTFSWKKIRWSDWGREIQVTLDSHTLFLAPCVKWQYELLESSVDRDVTCEMDDNPERFTYMVWTGCGISYCCPTLSWSVQHLWDGSLRLYNFYSRTLDGYFDKEDPRSDAIWHYHVDKTITHDEYSKFVQWIIQ